MSGTRRVLTAGLGILVAAIVNEAVPRVFDRFDRNPGYRVVIETNPDLISGTQGPLGGSYLFDRAIADVADPPGDKDSCVGRFAWARKQGGVDADGTTARMTVEATGDETVHLEGIAVDVLDVRPPPPGSHVTCGGRGGSPDVRAVTAVLAEEPEVTTTDADGRPIRFLFDVRDDSEVFDLTGLAPDCDCTWHARLRVRVGNRRASVVVDDHGEPFRTVSSAGARSYRWVDGAWHDDDTAPVPPSVPATEDNTIGCNLLPHSDIDALVGSSTRVVPSYNSLGPGAAGVPTRSSACSYLLDTTTGSNAQPALTVELTTADSAEEARQELAARVDLSSNGAAREAVAGLGEEAYRIPDGLVARHGAELVTVYLTAPPNEDAAASPDRVLRAITERRWS